MQIRKEYWKICINCDKSYDDDEALYCDKQKECKIIERDKSIHVRDERTQTQPIQANNKHIKRTGTSRGDVEGARKD